MEDKNENEEEEEKEEIKNDLINKKRRRDKKKFKQEKNQIINNNNQKKEPRKTRQKILNEYYNLKPTIKISHNVRLIEPYEFKYQVYVKGRWVGKKLIDVLDSEFHSYPREYYKTSIKEGKILINEKPTCEDYLLKDNDFLTHLTIRKENPIIFKKLEIIFEDENYLVVDKPSS